MRVCADPRPVSAISPLIQARAVALYTMVAVIGAAVVVTARRSLTMELVTVFLPPPLIGPPTPPPNPCGRVARGGHRDRGPPACVCVISGEDFKGTTRTPDGVECTLGRLVFNIFEPVKMPVLITSIENTLGQRPEKASSTDESSYQIKTHFSARDESGIRGITSLDGVIAEDPSDPTRLVIKFLKGSIEPEEGQDLDSWSKVIGVKDLTDKDSKGPLSWAKEKALGLMLKLAFGFRGPADELGSRGELSYEMKRSPSASLDVKFIDDDMRITVGNKGAVIVAVRR